MEQRKTLQELTLFDRFLFDETVEKPENMRTMLEIILGKEVVLKYIPQTEKEQRTSSDFRFVKLDVWAQDVDGVIYNTEVQKRNTGNLPKRSRYYQSLIDSKLLGPGALDFNQINPVVIILIAPFDLFGLGRYRYTFSMQCEEASGVNLDDGALRIFLNTRGTDDEDISPELKELLYFMENTNEAGVEIQSDRVKKLRESVQSIQNNAELGVRYMQAWEEKILDRQEAREEGLKEGREEGLKQGKEEGLKQGKEEGLKQGKEEGLKQGKEEGLKQGKEEGLKLGREEALQEARSEKIQIFVNLLNNGMSVDEAKSVMECSDDIAEQALMITKRHC